MVYIPSSHWKLLFILTDGIPLVLVEFSLEKVIQSWAHTQDPVINTLVSWSWCVHNTRPWECKQHQQDGE